MSIVGPRPLAVHHYERDLKQGNVARSLIKGGLIGLGHVLKGTPQIGEPIYEYEYIDQYLKMVVFNKCSFLKMFVLKKCPLQRCSFFKLFFFKVRFVNDRLCFVIIFFLG